MTQQRTPSSSTDKPSKPHPDFPLSPRRDGRFSKKIFGKVYTFSGTAAEALAKYEQLLDQLQPQDVAEPAIRDVLNLYLTAQQAKQQSGEITYRTFADAKAVCDKIAAHFGTRFPLGNLDPSQAIALRSALCRGVGLVTQSERIMLARSVFRFAHDRLVLSVPFHRWIDAVDGKKLRRAQEAVNRTVPPEVIRQLIEVANVPLKAMVLLGINCAFEPHDCGDLPKSHVDLESGWHWFPRPKTGERRRAKLWPETVEAIRAALKLKRKPKATEFADRVFLTKTGAPYVRPDRTDNAISKEFHKLATTAKVKRPGVSFMSLRHSFATAAGNSLDQVSVNYIMGHRDASMAANYRDMSQFPDDRLEAVAEFMHGWLFPKNGG